MLSECDFVNAIRPLELNAELDDINNNDNDVIKDTNNKMTNSRPTALSIVLLMRITCAMLSALPGNAFNLDLGTSALVHQGMINSSFGFSVAFHHERNHTWLLVGAPTAQTNQPGVEKGGAVYRCSIEAPNACHEVSFDRSGPKVESNNGIPERVDNKSHQFFGATLLSSGPNGIVVACAPRYVYFSSNFKRREPVGTCYVSRNYFTGFQEHAPCRTSDWGYHRQGSCQAGFSAAFSKDGRKLFIGAVGSWYWQGQVFSQDVYVRSDVISTNEQPAHFDDSYLGYSMTTGQFTGDQTTGFTGTDVAVGVPRGHALTGKVVIFNSTLWAVNEVVGDQIGSYFGYALCTSDIDGDSADDLIVAAPMYSNFTAKDGAYENGRVYVYYQGKKSLKKKFIKWNTLDGEVARGRFGLSLASMGDLNRDSYGDFAVGAPYGGNDGSGAVYIFHGSRSGVVIKPSQVIYAKEIRNNLKTFGFSLAGGLDIDSNQYPDLLIGAYQVDRVVLLKARPIVSVLAKLNIEPEKINLDEKGCSLLDNQQVSCVIVSTHLLFSGDNVDKTLEFEIETILDSKTEVNGARLFFLSNEMTNRFRSIERLTKGVAHVKKVFVYIDSNVRDKLTPITVQMRYNLLMDNRTSATNLYNHNIKIITPILNRYIDTNLIKEVNILTHCGKDNVCVPDLNVTATPVQNEYIMDSGQKLMLDIDIWNNGEDAFQATFYLELPVGVNYVNANYKQMDVPVGCSIDELNASIVKCGIGNPLPQSSHISLQVILAPFYFNSSDVMYDFLLEVNSTNPENDSCLFDNMFLVQVPIKMVVDLYVSGTNYIDLVLYNKSIIPPNYKFKESDIGPEIIHIYTVKNRGPSNVTQVSVVILWPTYTLSHNHLLYLLEQPDVIGTGNCEPIPNVNPENITLEQSTSLYYFPLMKINNRNNLIDSSIQELPILIDYLGGNDIINVTGRPKRRKQRSNNDDDFQKELSCGPTLCTQIHCQAYNLAANQSVLFRIRSRLWTETLIKFGFDNVTISSKLVAKITKLQFPFQSNNLDHKSVIVNTLVNPVDGDVVRRYVPWWIIAAAVCTGVLLFALLVLILWKVGFFERKRPRDEFGIGKNGGVHHEREPLNSKIEKNGMVLELCDEAL